MRLQLGQTQLELSCMKTGKKSSKHRANVGLRPITCEDCESEIFSLMFVVSHCYNVDFLRTELLKMSFSQLLSVMKHSKQHQH